MKLPSFPVPGVEFNKRILKLGAGKGGNSGLRGLILYIIYCII